MGMYNEVFKSCPHCEGGCGYMQIHQIVLGFGGFNLNDPASIARQLSKDEIIELKEAVEREGWFRCTQCDRTFPVSEETEEDKIDILNSIGK